MKKHIALCGTLAFTLAIVGCSHQSIGPSPNRARASARGIGPNVLQTGKTPVQWTEFNWGGPNSPFQYTAIVMGPDKNMWYTDYYDSTLTKMTMAGKTHAYPLKIGSTNFNPGYLTVGADGKFYILPSSLSYIGVATTSGVFSTIAIPSGDTVIGSGGAALGPDGNVWFAESSHIASVSPAGTITEYLYPDLATNGYGAVAAGPGGDVWVAENSNIDDVDTSSGDIVQYPLACGASALVAPSDGNIWAMCYNSIVRVTPGGNETAYFTPPSNQYSGGATVGPDGNPWFALNSSSSIAEFNISQTTLNIYFPPTNYASDYALAAGPDGNMWAVSNNGKIGVYIINVIKVTPKSLTFTTTGLMQTLTVKETGATAWTAASSNTAVATVVQGTQANQFTVTSTGIGTATITISDAVGNMFAAKVTVQ